MVVLYQIEIMDFNCFKPQTKANYMYFQYNETFSQLGEWLKKKMKFGCGFAYYWSSQKPKFNIYVDVEPKTQL